MKNSEWVQMTPQEYSALKVGDKVYGKRNHSVYKGTIEEIVNGLSFPWRVRLTDASDVSLVGRKMFMGWFNISGVGEDYPEE